MANPLFRDEDFFIGQKKKQDTALVSIFQRFSAVTNELLPTAFSVWMSKIQFHHQHPLASGIIILASISLAALLQKTNWTQPPWRMKNQNIQSTDIATGATSIPTIQDEETINSTAIISSDANLIMNGDLVEEDSKNPVVSVTIASDDDSSTAINATTTSNVVAQEEEREDLIDDNVYIDDVLLWKQKYETVVTEWSNVQTQLERSEHELVGARSALESWQSEAQYWETIAKEQEAQFHSTLHTERKQNRDQIVRFKDAMIEIVQSEKKELMEQFQKQLLDLQQTFREEPQQQEEKEEGDLL